jgi:hypothetical protein
VSPITKPAAPAKPAVPGAKPEVPGGDDDEPRSKLLIFGMVVVVAMFVAAVGMSIRDKNYRFGSPAGSRLRYVENVLRPTTLSVADIARTGSTCLSGRSLVLAPQGSGCEIIVPPGVRRITLRRVTNSPSMTVTVSRTSDITQTADTAKAGPDRHHPAQLRFAVPYDGATLTLSSCAGPTPCRIDIGG